MMDSILENGDIIIDGKASQYSVKQSAVNTVVIDMTLRKPVPMPARVYNLCKPEQFFKDLKSTIGRISIAPGFHEFSGLDIITDCSGNIFCFRYQKHSD